MTNVNYDVIIVGAGLTGLTLAHALAQQHFSVAIIEKKSLAPTTPNAAPIKSDGRALAMSLSAQKILEKLALWDVVATHAIPIKSVHVSEQGVFGKVRLNAADMHWPALGYMVPYANLGEALLNKTQNAAKIKIFSPMEVMTLEHIAENTRTVSVQQPSGETLQLKGKLAIVAEGSAENIKQHFTFTQHQSQREQHVIVADVETSGAHDNIAYQRFTSRGILAILPRSPNKVTVVWTIHPNDLLEWQSLSDEAWLTRLQKSFGYKLGLFKTVGKKHYYPVKQFALENPYYARLLLLGNAAHTLSPVAAQGFNLTLRDISLLVDLLVQARQNQEDIGEIALLERYQNLRNTDQKTVYHFTDKLIEIFSWPYFKSMRSLGLFVCDRLPFLKSAFIERIEGINEFT